MLYFKHLRSVALLLLVLLTLSGSAGEIEQQYPNYNDVFGAFDIESSYRNNEDFVWFVQKNEAHLKRFYQNALHRGKEILPMIKNLLSQEGMSELFVYLAMVEAGLVSDAVSAKKAVGLWQFMPQTAKMYDLNVDYLYDERYDAFSATHAAIKYLHKLHKQFGKWYLAMMAYNCGEGRLSRAIERAGSDALEVLSSEYFGYVPKETRVYIKKILLLAMIGKQKSHVEKMSYDFVDNIERVEVELPLGVPLCRVAKLLDVNMSTLNTLNPHRKKAQRASKIYIPLEKIYQYYLKYDTLLVPQKSLEYLLSYRVEQGDTLERIAQKYHTNVADLIYVNHIEDSALELHRLLVVPVSKEVFEDREKE